MYSGEKEYKDMRTNIVFTLTGTDRVGIVEEVTKLLLDLGGNIETSRMAKLGGEFAVLLLVSFPSESLPGLDKVSERLTGQGYKITFSQTKTAPVAAHTNWPSYKIEVVGADHEGIIHQIAHDCSRRGINIESMETETSQAPISGTPLFSMTARVVVPPNLVGEGWKKDLTAVGHSLNVDIKISDIQE
jgi:glycine cleavage system transcriptional repressor